METNWQCVDLTNFSCLHFTILVTGDFLPDITVGFVVTALDGSETDTPVVRLRDLGLSLGQRMDFAIPLDKFWTKEVNRRRIRLARWTGGGSFSMELSRIYID